MSNLLDTRDLQQRLDELESDRDSALEDAIEEAKDALADASEVVPAFDEDTFKEAWVWNDEDAAEELKELTELSEEISEWRHGVTLIPEDGFEDYARELADDLGLIDRDTPWPLNCIDWERAASELQQDYTSCEYQGTTYLFRE